jgi:hypothetical protein
VTADVAGQAVSSIEDIEKAVANLPPRDLAIFSAWFEAFEAERFDRQILQDAEAGKLDGLAEAALMEFRKGPAREMRSISPAKNFGLPMDDYWAPSSVPCHSRASGNPAGPRRIEIQAS